MVRDKLFLSHQSLSNYIINLTKKGFIKEEEDESDNLTLLPILFPNDKEQVYLLKIIKKDN
jgi:hypothetical protein